MSTRIAQIVPFSINEPTHGGQVRANMMSAVLKSLGADLSVIGFDPSNKPGLYVKKLPNQIYAGPPLWDHHIHYFVSDYLADFTMGKVFSENIAYFEILFDCIDPSTDIFVIEHPWLLHFSLKAMKKLDNNCKYYANTHNHEYALKKKISEDLGLSSEGQGKALQDLYELEKEYLLGATHVFAVSQSDADAFTENYGVNSSKITVCPNGASVYGSSFRTIQHLPQACRNDPFALYVGSAHPPNASGFFDLLSGPSPLIEGKYKVIICGSICNLLEPMLKSDPMLNRLLESGILILLGVVSDSDLCALTLAAKIILIPLLSGGGTSLKAASALVNQKIVLSTSIGLRGFEQFIDFPEVIIADSPSEFKYHLHSLMKTPANQLYESMSVDYLQLSTQLQWSNTLKGFSDKVAAQIQVS